MKKIFKLILKILSISFILLLIIYSILNFISPKKTTRIIGFNFYNVTSDSMSPKYDKGDIIFTTYSKEKNLKVGDVITFDTYVKNKTNIVNINVTHYIAKIEYVDNVAHFYTQTYDNYHAKNKKFDVWYKADGTEIQYVTHDKIYGSVKFNIPGLGNFINKLSALVLQPLFYVFIGVIVAILMVMYYFYKNSIENKKQ